MKTTMTAMLYLVIVFFCATASMAATFARITASSNVTIVAFDESGFLTWTNDVVPAQYSVMTSTNLDSDVWDVVESGTATSATQRCWIDIRGTGLHFMVTGRVRHKDLILRGYPVRLADYNTYETIRQTKTAWSTGAYRYSQVSPGPYVAWADDHDIYLNFGEAITVTSSNIDVDIHVPRNISSTVHPAHNTNISDTTPLISWEAYPGVVLWEYRIQNWQTNIEGYTTANQYQVESPLPADCYNISIFGYDAEFTDPDWHEIARAWVSVCIVP